MNTVTLPLTIGRVKGTSHHYKVRIGGIRIGEINVDVTDVATWTWVECKRFDEMTDEGMETVNRALDDVVSEL